MPPQAESSTAAASVSAASLSHVGLSARVSEAPQTPHPLWLPARPMVSLLPGRSLRGATAERTQRGDVRAEQNEREEQQHGIELHTLVEGMQWVDPGNRLVVHE